MPQSLPPIKTKCGELCLDSHKKASLFNSNFSSVFIKDNGIKPPVSPFSNPVQTEMPNFIVFPGDVKESILSLKQSTSRSPDDIPAIFLKRTMDYLVYPLSKIYNLSLLQSKLPLLWKQAIVVPVHKKGLRNLTSNYRPISLTSNVCRVLERIVHKKVSSHLLSNNLIGNAQHGFLCNRSTLSQHFHLLDKLTEYHEKRTSVDMVYLDFSKAFDRVSHGKLLYVLQYYNLNSKVIKWLTDYLFNRKQKTVVDNCFSESLAITSGVPQGSVLGPLLFILYVEDLIRKLCTTCQSVTVFAFADDLKLLCHDPVKLQEALEIVGKWTIEWQLPIQPNKSENIAFVHGTTQSTTFNINGMNVPKVDVVKDLGLKVTNNLKWNSYILNSKFKADNLSSLILRVFKTRDLSNYIAAYKTYIRPLLEYNTSIWTPYLTSDIKLVESVQRRFTRIMCNKLNIKFSSYSERLEILGIESLEYRRMKFDLVLMYKIYHNLIHIKFDTFFTKNPSNYHLRRHTCTIKNTKIPRSRIRNHFFSHRIVKLWNSLPNDVVNSKTLKIFKNQLNEVNLADLISLTFT